MAKWLQLVSESDLCEVKSKSVDWAICILCQNPSDENLIFHANNTNVVSQNAGYATLDSINALLMDINTNMFNEDCDGIEDTVLKKKAKWHKKYALKYNSKMFERAK